MKLQSLSAFIVLLTLLNCVHFTYTQTPITGYFFLQKVYGGNDPLLIIKHSQQTMSLKYFTLNDKVLSYSENQEKIKVIEGNTY